MAHLKYIFYLQQFLHDKTFAPTHLPQQNRLQLDNIFTVKFLQPVARQWRHFRDNKAVDCWDSQCPVVEAVEQQERKYNLAEQYFEVFSFLVQSHALISAMSKTL